MIERVLRQFGIVGMRCLALMLMVLATNLQAAPLQGDLQLQASREGPYWVGQQIELNLDIWSSGFSFSGQRFLLPEVNGAYLMQVDSSTIKLTEQRDGETWQGLRYTILAYTQKAGFIEIPSFIVEFSAGAGYGSEATPFRMDTPALEIEARLPPGVGRQSLLVATSDFEMSYQWMPDIDAEEPLQLTTGDALTLTVNRTAAAVPGMVFSPLPDFQIGGLQAYPDPPKVNDSANRGELVGSRSDSVTFICEREGLFEIPAITFQWWDPATETLHEETISGLQVNVEANPAFQVTEEPLNASSLERYSMRNVLLILSAIVVIALAGWKGVGWLRNWQREKRLKYEAGEQWAFEQALTACRSGNAAKAYQAINLWLTRYSGSGDGLTLSGLARKSGQAGLVQEAEALQAAVIASDGKTWNGRELAAGLHRFRNADEKHRKQVSPLPPLNPAR